MGVALYEARQDVTLLGMYAVGFLHGVLLFAILSRSNGEQLQPQAVEATAIQKAPTKAPPAAQITMTVDDFESLRAGRKQDSGAPRTPSSSSRRKSLRTPKEVRRLGEWEQ